MTQFLHDFGLFAGGWIFGWLVLHLWPLLTKIWPEIKAICYEWKHPGGKSN